MTAATLQIDIRTYWHPGTGRGSGYHLDALTHTGADGLPRLPGRTLKGLLRDALYRAERWGWPAVPAGTTRCLFGSRTGGTETADSASATTSDREPPTDENLSTPGLLRVSDATLPEDVAAWLTTDDGRKLVPGLYREHFSTRVEVGTGVAQGRSLRGMRVVVPLELSARIAEVPGPFHAEEDRELLAKLQAGGHWKAILETVFPLIPAVGAHRTRGFGRARLAWT
jgi:hypothetical protein